MEFTTHFGLHSQTTRLSEGDPGCAPPLRARGSHPLRRAVPGQLWSGGTPPQPPLAATIRRRKRRRLTARALPSSLAVTGGIQVGFSSSAY